MTGKRFVFTYGNVSTFADRLRISSYKCPISGRFHLALHAGDPANEEPEQAPVDIDLPKQDAGAYRRAAEAFNAILDEHERTIAARNAKRRAPAGASCAQPLPAASAASRLDL